MAQTDPSPSLYNNFQRPPHTVTGRKRGRPRKYNSTEEAAAGKKLLLATKKHISPPATGSSSKNSFLGNAGKGFTPYIINVATGEDINHKIMSFMQQSKQEICVMSASGVISSASLRQPDAWGGKVTYQGTFDIISLCGSYVHADHESRTGGLSICVSSNEGQIVGGGVDGPLIAAGPVQVIVGTFVISSKKTATDAVTEDDASVGASVPDVGFPSVPDSPARNSVFGNDSNHQNNDLLRELIPCLTFFGIRNNPNS